MAWLSRSSSLYRSKISSGVDSEAGSLGAVVVVDNEDADADADADADDDDDDEDDEDDDDAAFAFFLELGGDFLLAALPPAFALRFGAILSAAIWRQGLESFRDLSELVSSLRTPPKRERSGATTEIR